MVENAIASTRKPPPRPSSTASTTYAPTIGADAAIIASHITGCTGAQAGDVGKGTPDLSSTATCTLDGHLLIVDSFATPSGPGDVPALVGKVETYYAYGSTGWLTFLASPAGPAKTQLQMQITNDAGGLLDQSLNGAPTLVDVDAQRQAASAVVAALGGTLAHVG